MENKQLPNHVAIILDGNGRWAKKRGLPRTLGHKAGAENLYKLANYANKIGIKEMTVYAFSTENWSRPAKEVEYLMALFSSWFERLINKMDETVKIKIIGEKEHVSQKLLDEIVKLEKKSENYPGMLLNICFNYGSRDEIINSVKAMIDNKEDITKENLSKHLYADDVDLLIRTSGEQRISNFLLWQISYSELYFTDVYWPDFGPEELDKALESYQNRDRRYGGLKEEK